MRSSKSRFVGLFAGAALCAGVLAAAPARAQLPPEAGYEAGAEVYAAPEDPSVEVQGYAQPQPAYAAPQGYAQPQPAYAPQPGYAVAPQGAFTFLAGHPIPHEQGGGFCQAQGAHQHAYGPFDHHLFREVNGAYSFIGDPADFGYNAPYQYAGNHPIDDYHGGGYCYIGWGHRHLFAPVGVGFSLIGGAYNYAGPYGADYYAPRVAWASYYNNYYRSNYWGGRYYSVRPRPVYLGFGYRGVGARPYWAPSYRAPVYAPRPAFAAPYYRGPAYAPRPVFQTPAYRAPVYAPRPVFQTPAYRAPVYAPRPMYQAPAYAPRSYVPAPAPAAFHGGGGGRYAPAPSFGGGGGGRYAPAPSFGGGGGGGGRYAPAPSFGGGGGGGHFGGGPGGGGPGRR